MPTRKPKIDIPQRPTAYEVLNKFLKENNIFLTIGKPKISFTDANQIIIDNPQIFAIYKDEIKTDKKEAN